MAIDFDQLFARLGKLIRWTNLWLAYQPTLLAGADEVLDEYEDRRDLAKSLQQAFESDASAAAGWIAPLKSVADATLADLQSELGARARDVPTILPLLAAAMATAGEAVERNVVGTPTVTPAGANVGNALLYASAKTLAGVDDERILDGETIRLLVTGDRFTGGSSGAEQLQVTGQPANPSTSHLPRGSGNGPTLTVIDAANKLLNGGLETFTVANVPDSWTLGTGAAAGTTIVKEATNFHRGAAALRVAGNGVATSIVVSQTPAAGVLATSTIYAVGIWLRKAGTVSGGSTLTVAVKGTGFSSVNLFAADPSTLTTSYVHYAAFFSTPAAMPADLRLDLSWTSANAAGATAQVLVDDAVIAAPTSFAHLQLALFAGAADLVKGDGYTVETTNDNAGVIQSWFGRFYDAALPSATSGAETQADALAT